MILAGLLFLGRASLANAQTISDCLDCHSRIPPQAAPERKDRVRFFRTGSGQRVLDLIAPIPNKPACSNAACHAHPAAQRILGVLDIDMSLAEEDQALTSYQGQSIALGILTALLAAFAVSVIVQRYYVSPVRRLLKSSREPKAWDRSFPPLPRGARTNWHNCKSSSRG